MSSNPLSPAQKRARMRQEATEFMNKIDFADPRELSWRNLNSTMPLAGDVSTSYEESVGVSKAYKKVEPPKYEFKIVNAKTRTNRSSLTWAIGNGAPDAPPPPTPFERAKAAAANKPRPVPVATQTPKQVKPPRVSGIRASPLRFNPPAEKPQRKSAFGKVHNLHRSTFSLAEMEPEPIPNQLKRGSRPRTPLPVPNDTSVLSLRVGSEPAPVNKPKQSVASTRRQQNLSTTFVLE